MKQVYRLYRPSNPASSMSICYSHSLYGHTAGIAALRVADGRCVSVGQEARVWVWDLEAGGSVCIGSGDEDYTSQSVGEAGVLEPDTEAKELSSSTSDASQQSSRPHGGVGPSDTQPIVVFDEQRVVALSRKGVDIWHFDL